MSYSLSTPLRAFHHFPEQVKGEGWAGSASLWASWGGAGRGREVTGAQSPGNASQPALRLAGPGPRANRHPLLPACPSALMLLSGEPA